jgi:regulatory protein
MPGEYTPARRRSGQRACGGRADTADTDTNTAAEPRKERADPEAKAREICLRLLTLEPKTRAQLKDVLCKGGIPEDAAETVLSRFADVGLIDDAAFARAWVESRHHSKGLAGRALKAELRRRGVDDDEIREAIATLDPDAEVETARRLVQRKLAGTRGQPPQARTRRLAGMLARKGYPPGLAFRVIREALEAEDTDEATLGAIEELEDGSFDDGFGSYTE